MTTTAAILNFGFYPDDSICELELLQAVHTKDKLLGK